MSLLVTFRRAARDEFIKATAWYEVRHPARSEGINCADLRSLILHSPQPGPNHARRPKNQRPSFVLSLHRENIRPTDFSLDRDFAGSWRLEAHGVGEPAQNQASNRPRARECTGGALSR